MKTAEEKAKEYLDKISGDSLGSPINAAYSGFIAGYNEAMRCQSNPKIKQLEWSEERSPDNNISYNHVKANSPLGMYTIQWKGWKEYDDRTICLDGDFISMGGDFLDDAKILAQEDFEARVKKCLIIE